MKNHHEKPSKNHGWIPWKTIRERPAPWWETPQQSARVVHRVRRPQTSMQGLVDLPIGEAGWPVDNNGYILWMVNNG
jgi:hypothetical protein